MERTMHFLLMESDISIRIECWKDNHPLWVIAYLNSMCWKHDYQEGEDLRWKRFLMPSIGLLMRYIQNCGEHEKRSFCVAYLWPNVLKFKLCFRVVYLLEKLFSIAKYWAYPITSYELGQPRLHINISLFFSLY